MEVLDIARSEADGRGVEGSVWKRQGQSVAQNREWSACPAVGPARSGLSQGKAEHRFTEVYANYDPSRADVMGKHAREVACAGTDVKRSPARAQHGQLSGAPPPTPVQSEAE